MSEWSKRNFQSEPTEEDWSVILKIFSHGDMLLVMDTLHKSRNEPLPIEFFWKQKLSYSAIQGGVNNKFKKLGLPYKLVSYGRQALKTLVDRPQTTIASNRLMYYKYKDLNSAQQKICEILAWIGVNKPSILPKELQERLKEIKSSSLPLDMQDHADLYQDAIARWVASAHLPEGYVVSWPRLG